VGYAFAAATPNHRTTRPRWLALRDVPRFNARMPELTRPDKITFAQMPEMGVRGVLIYCADHKCSHSIEMMSADRWPDDVRLSDIEDQFVCRACGKRGADVRPNFAPARMGTG
jgi:hypothetical protein